jgi:hypothetical protein
MEKLLIVGEEYIDIIKTFLEAGYSFESFCNRASTKKSAVLLRHDVDFSVEAALKVAKLDKELGVSSTFFFMLNSVFYNIFARKDYEQIVEIADMGHTVSLHMEKGFCNISQFAYKTHKIFCDWIKSVEKNIVSVHRPGSLTPDCELPKGIKSVYDPEYTQDMKYFSDSGCKWYENPLTSQEFKERKNIQLLLHPIWWVYEGESVSEIFERFLAEREEILKEEIKKNFSQKLKWKNE